VATEDMVNLSADLVETWLCVRDFGFWINSCKKILSIIILHLQNEVH
jgi:hypothetical protein